MIKKTIVAIFALVVMVTSNRAEAQTYSNGIGLRAGVTNGITFKQFITYEGAVEAMLHSRWKGLIFTALYEHHKDIREIKGLNWFFGGGAHVGKWGPKSNQAFHDDNREYTVIGLDGIVGFDYKFEDAPVNMSLDYKPVFNLTDDARSLYDEIALSIRYTFH